MNGFCYNCVIQINTFHGIQRYINRILEIIELLHGII